MYEKFMSKNEDLVDIRNVKNNPDLPSEENINIANYIVIRQFSTKSTLKEILVNKIINNK